MDAKDQASGVIPAKTAVLLIHGIGQQQPYETIDAFARGLCRTVSKHTGHQPRIRHDLIKLNTWTESRLHVSWQVSDKNQGKTPPELDLYEVCWAPLTQRRIGYLQVLRFLQAAALSPLRYLATNLDVLLAERPQDNRAYGRIWIVSREMLRTVIFYIPLLLLLLAFGSLVPTISRLGTAVNNGLSVIRSVAFQNYANFTLNCLEVILAIILLVIAKGWWGLSRSKHSINAPAEKVLKKWLLIYGVLFLLLLTAKILIWGSGIKTILTEVPWNLWGSGMALILFFWAKKGLVDFIGDIAIYVNMDENSEFFQARAAILNEAVDKLRWLCRQEHYDKIVVAGHSLGSVIAHNSINKLLLEADRSGNASSDFTWKEASKIVLLVTFGSPLDKVYYFFRTHVKSDQAVRSQILSDRYPFARRQSRQSKIESGLKGSSWERDYGEFTFADPPSPRQMHPDQHSTLSSFQWLNIWYGGDPVSGHLNFYDPTKLLNIKLPSSSWRFGRAHLDYWSDPIFYQRVFDAIRSYS